MPRLDLRYAALEVPVAGKHRFLQLERFRIEAPRFSECLVDARHYRLKTEFILDYLSQPALRTRIRRGLLKGEQLHALARCVHYGRLGRLDQRDFERQTGAASCLLLILAAIIHWQIREIDRVLSEAGSDADDLNFELLSHISPIGWDNVLLYGEYQLNRSLVRSERLSV